MQSRAPTGKVIAGIGGSIDEDRHDALAAVVV